MIRISHSTARQMLRQQHRAAGRSALFTLLALISAAAAAFHTHTGTTYHEAHNNLKGIHFLPLTETTLPEKPKHPRKLTKVIYSAPTFPLVTTFLPETKVEQTNCELDLPDTPAEESDLLETDAEMLLLAPRQDSAPPARQEDTPREKENYIPPAYKHCPSPPRPAALRRQRQNLIVGVLIEIDAEGCPREVNITHPSGNRTLDQHTRSWILRNWRFTPASHHGKAVDAKVSTELRYTLAD